MTERVVITGMGIVCPLGHDAETLWQAILAGRSGVAKTTIFNASTFPTTFDAEVKDYDFAEYTKIRSCTNTAIEAPALPSAPRLRPAERQGLILKPQSRPTE